MALSEVIRSFRSGLVGPDEFMEGMIAEGMTPDYAARTLTALRTQGQSAEARMAKRGIEQNPTFASLYDTNTTAGAQSQRDDMIARVQADAARAAEGREKWGQIVDSLKSDPIGNLGYAASSIVPQALQFLGQGAQLGTMGAVGKGLEDYGAGAQDLAMQIFGSPKLKEQAKLLSATTDGGDINEALDFIFQNPGGTAALSAPSLIASMAVAAGPGAVAGRRALAAGLTRAEAGARAAGAANTGNAVLNASQTFSENADEDMNPLQNLIGSLATGVVSKAVGSKLEGGAEGIVARRFVDGAPATSSIADALKAIGRGAGLGALDELNDNTSVELGKALSQHRPMDIAATVAQAIPDMVAGGIMGGAGKVNLPSSTKPQNQTITAAIPDVMRPNMAAQSTQPAPAEQPAVTEEANAVDSVGAILEKMLQDAERKRDQNATTAPQTKSQTVVAPDVQAAQQTENRPQPSAQTAPEEKQPQPQSVEPTQQQLPLPAVAEETEQVAKPTTETSIPRTIDESGRKVIVQNRNRSSKAAIAQMNDIAARPDYALMAPMRNFENGAPVVAYGSVDAQRLGKKGFAVSSSTHRRIPIQYAVVEANDVLTSNNADGTPINDYETAGADRMRAIAGNARIAGVTEGYRRGTTAQYRKELEEDTDAHGIPVDVIRKMKQPILVRMMPENEITADIGDLSNTQSNQGMSKVEQTSNDASRLRPEDIALNPDGRVSRKTVESFIATLPQTERAEMLEDDGKPTQQAYDRINALCFRMAFNSDELVRRFAQSTDEELRNVLGAMGEAAPHFVRLHDAGDLNISDLVLQAAELIMSAKLSGQAYEDYFANEGMLDGDPAVKMIASAFARNIRSRKKITESLIMAADFAYDQANSPAETLFGTAERATRQDVVDIITGERNERPQQAEQQVSDVFGADSLWNESSGSQNLEQPTGSKSAGQDVRRGDDRIETDDRRQGDDRRAEEKPDHQQVTEESSTDGHLSFSERQDSGASSVELIDKALRRDPDVGSIFTVLTESGTVQVVESVDDIRAAVQESRTAKEDPEVNISRGRAAMERAFQNKTTVHRAMYRKDLGWIDFIMGTEGGERLANAKHGKGRGLLHLIEARVNRDHLNKEEIQQLLDDLVVTIARGTVLRRTEVAGRFRVMIGYRDAEVSITKNPASNAWLLTGYFVRNEDDQKGANDFQSSTNRPPHLAGDLKGAPSLSPKINNERHALAPANLAGGLGERVSIETNSSVDEDNLQIKRSERGSIQGAYDPETGRAYLVAENLTEATAKGVFLHEVGVHMAADRGGFMKGQVKHAHVMLNRALAAGDDMARRVRSRLVDAGLMTKNADKIPNAAAEEALAYLVEMAANESDQRSAWRKWWDSLVAAFKNWLHDHGIDVELSDRDFLEMARGAALSLAELSAQSGRGAVRMSRRSMPDENGRTPGPNKNRTARRSAFSLLEDDGVGGKRFWPGERAYRLVSAGVSKVLASKILRMRPMSKELRMLFRDMKAEEDRGRRTAKEFADAMKDMSVNDRNLISDCIEGEVATGVVPPKQVLRYAELMTHIVDTQAEELLDLGMISKETFERYRGRYLPRLYDRRRLFEDQSLMKRFFPAQPLRALRGDHLKGRGLFQEVPAESVDHHIRLGWEVRDSRFRWDEKDKRLKWADGRTTIDGEAEIQPGIPVGIWRDYTKSEREQMNEVRDAGVRFTLYSLETSRNLALGRLYRFIAQNPEWVRNSESDGFFFVSDATIPESGGVKRYGALAGKWVSAEVRDAFVTPQQADNAVYKAYKYALALWKEGKTAMNPVSHFNNSVGNWMAAHFAGVNMLDAKAYVTTLHSLIKKDASFKEAEDAGLFSGSFSASEITDSLPPEFRDFILNANDDTPLVHSGDVMMRVLTFGLRNKLGAAYQAEDVLFRHLIYRHARDAGLNSQEAVDYATRYIFTYDDLPAGAQALRDTVLPFFAWTYKAVPMLAKTAALYPWRLLAPAAVLTTLNKLSYLASVAAGDDDWIEKWVKASELEESERKLMPDYMQGWGALMNPKFLRLGVDETTGLPRYINVAYAIPGGSFFDLENQSGGLPLPEMVMPSHPALTLMTALLWNKDTFTGWEVVRDTDTAKEKVQKWGKYLWRQATPAIAIGNYHFDRLMSGIASAAGTPLPNPLGDDWTGQDRYGNPMPLDVALQNLLGLKVRTFDADLEVQRAQTRARAETSQIRSEARQALRNRTRGAITDQDARNYVEKARRKIHDSQNELQEKKKARERIREISGK